ncbi:hypothetical protein ACFL4A_02200 [bacterium]
MTQKAAPNTNVTPLMKQYYEVKNKYPDIIVFFRLGDFYEMFEDDAKKASQILSITLTKRNGIPMCGVPHHSAGNYMSKLLKSGNKIGVCEQLEEPSKGTKIVKRGVVRVMSPGTVVEENMLDEKNNNYILGLFPDLDTNELGLTIIDISTGDFLGALFDNLNDIDSIISEIKKYSPTEIILPAEFDNLPLINTIKKNISAISTSLDNNYSDANLLNENLVNKVVKKNITSKTLFNASINMLNYVTRNYKSASEHLKQIKIYNPNHFMLMNENTIRHLELVENYYTRKRKHSLLDCIDTTLTPMGSRKIKDWLLKPLLDSKKIKIRQKIVKFFVENNSIRESIRENLKNIRDIDRLISRISCNANTPRDIVGLKMSLEILPKICESLQSSNEIIKVFFMSSIIFKSICLNGNFTNTDGDLWSAYSTSASANAVSHDLHQYTGFCPR